MMLCLSNFTRANDDQTKVARCVIPDAPHSRDSVHPESLPLFDLPQPSPKDMTHLYQDLEDKFLAVLQTHSNSLLHWHCRMGGLLQGTRLDRVHCGCHKLRALKANSLNSCVAIVAYSQDL